MKAFLRGFIKGLSLSPLCEFIARPYVLAEREQCAKICDEFHVPEKILGAHPDYLEGQRMAFSKAAIEIRNRQRIKK